MVQSRRRPLLPAQTAYNFAVPRLKRQQKQEAPLKPQKNGAFFARQKARQKGQKAPLKYKENVENCINSTAANVKNVRALNRRLKVKGARALKKEIKRAWKIVFSS